MLNLSFRGLLRGVDFIFFLLEKKKLIKFVKNGGRFLLHPFYCLFLEIKKKEKDDFPEASNIFECFLVFFCY